MPAQRNRVERFLYRPRFTYGMMVTRGAAATLQAQP